jgi:hypothetical protein
VAFEDRPGDVDPPEVLRRGLLWEVIAVLSKSRKANASRGRWQSLLFRYVAEKSTRQADDGKYLNTTEEWQSVYGREG